MLLAAPPALTAQAPASQPSVAASVGARTQGMERRDGFVSVYRDSAQDRIYLELPHDSLGALAFFTLATGLGSNPIGLDRGEDGASYVVRFDRSGSRVLVVFENWGFRSSSGNRAHVRSVQESFPPSTVAVLPLLAAEQGKLLVDATDGSTATFQSVARARGVPVEDATNPKARDSRAIKHNGPNPFYGRRRKAS